MANDKEIVQLDCCNCGIKFDKVGRRIKYCSDKCSNHAALKAWRGRARPLLSPKNCELCKDEFVPVRNWQRFCHRDCMIVHQNNFGRKSHQGKVTEPSITEIVEKYTDRHVYPKCITKGCKQYCKSIQRTYSDGTKKVVSHQQGFFTEDGIILCGICQERIERENNKVKVKNIKEPLARGFAARYSIF